MPRPYRPPLARHFALGLLATSLLAAALPACDASGPAPAEGPRAHGKPAPPPSEPGEVEVWRTLPDQSELLAQDPLGAALTATSTLRRAVVIDVDPAARFQTIEGFGAAVTGSAAYVLTEHLSASERAALLTDLFDVSGIGLSYVRMTLGASDFSLSDYTYDDVPAGQTDFAFEHFSIDPDRAHVIPVLQEVLAIAPAIGIVGSPWSPPAWMKTSGALEGGALQTSAYGAAAEYYARTIEAFAAEGIPIRAMTVQNEPEHAAAYPSMLMTASEQAAFVGGHLGPLFDQRGIATEILAFDHNWDNPGYPMAVLSDAAAAPYVDGSAFHCYAGDVSAMGQVYAAFPQKALHFTECSGGEWATHFGSNLKWNAEHILIRTTRNGSRTALLWNLALDENHGPTNGGCVDCRGVVTVDAQTGAVSRNVEYYVLGHAAKFVRPGAVRIASTDVSQSRVQNVAFENADGRYVVIALNESNRGQTVQVRLGGQAFAYELPGGSLVTFRW